MSHDQLVTAKRLLAAQAALRRAAADPLSDLEAREPDLAEFLLDRLSEAHRRLDSLGLPPKRVARLRKWFERTVLIALEAQRRAYRDLLLPEAEPPAPPLTPERVQAYVKDGGAACPLCQSPEIESTGDHDFVPGGYFNNVRCYACGAVWSELFTLTGADLRTPPKPRPTPPA